MKLLTRVRLAEAAAGGALSSRRAELPCWRSVARAIPSWERQEVPVCPAALALSDLVMCAWVRFERYLLFLSLCEEA